MPAILEPLECPASDVASVPRRFGVGVLMILMTAFAVLFAGMRSVGARPEVFILVSGLFFAVTLGQILLFQGKRPREASLMAGGVVFPLESLAMSLYYAPFNSVDPGFVAPMLCCSMVAGAPLGYLAGCIVAGIFFVQERFRRRSVQPVKIELLPFTAADFDTLISWVHHAPLFDLWSQGEFRYPLDHDQLAAHLSLTAGDPPDRLCIKAVCGEMQQMVAYAELVNIVREESPDGAEAGKPAVSLAPARAIDLGKPCASIEFAIVDPLRDDRDQLSNVLVLEIMYHAFHQLGLKWLGVVLHLSATESLECFRKHGFFDAQYKAPSRRPVGYQTLIRSNRY